MPFEARVLQVLIASPGDVLQERDTIAQVVHEWNAVYARERNVILMPLRWETDAYPVYGTPPQVAINEQVVDHADLAIGVFWTRLGTKTEIADSGTVEELDRVGASEKPVLLYFSKVPVDPDTLDLVQYASLSDYKRRTYPRSLIETYVSVDDFRAKLSRQLASAVRDVIDETARLPSLSNLSAPDLQLRVARTQAADLLADTDRIKLTRVLCPDEDKIPDFDSTRPAVESSGSIFKLGAFQDRDKNYYRRIVKWFQDSSQTAAFWLALVNDGETAVHDLHLDTRLETANEGSRLFIGKFEKPQPSLYAGLTLTGGPPAAVSGKTWRFEEDVAVVQVGRTIAWGSRIGWITPNGGSLDIESTVYSSAAPPFALRTVVSVDVEEKQMSYTEILEAAGVTVEHGIST